MIDNNVKCFKYMELIDAFPFCRPRKGNNVVNCFFLMHDSVLCIWHVTQQKTSEDRDGSRVIEIWTTHSFSSSLVADNVLWIIATADHFFGRCTNCTMYVWIVCNHKFMHVLPRHGATHLLLKIGPLTVLLGFFLWCLCWLKILLQATKLEFGVFILSTPRIFCDAFVDSKNSAASNQTGIWSFHSFNLLEVFPMLLFSR